MPSSKKPKLLLLTGVSPVPKDSGGATRIYNTIKYLSNYFDLFLIIFKPENHHFNPKHLQFIKKHSHWFTFFDIKEYRPPQSFIANFQPHWFSPWYSEEIQISIHNLIKKHQFKYAHIEQTQLAYLVKFFPANIKKIFIAQDIGVVTFWRRLHQIKILPIKIIHFARWLEIYLYERKYLPQFDSICAVSDTDQLLFQKIYKLKNICVVKNGIESIKFQTKVNPSKYIKLGYIGSFDHTPNLTAFIFFINQIAPLLEKNKVNYYFLIAGKNDNNKFKKLVNQSPLKNKTNIFNLGFVENVSDFFNHIDILVTPILSGSGSRIKILESLSFGTPIISTPIGLEGINIKNDIIKIANNPDEFVKAIIQTQKKLSTSKHPAYLNKLRTQLKPWLWSSIIKQYSKIILQT